MLRARKLASVALTSCLVTAGGIGTTVLSAGAAHAATCPTTSQIVTDINAIASAAGGISSQSGALTPSSSPGDVQSAAQSTATGLSTMVSDLSADTTASSGCSALSSPDSQTVADAFGSLTAVTQQMLSTLIGKHSIFAQFGVTAPVTSSLQSLEAALDSFTFALTAVAPSQQGAITTGKDSVDTPLGKAIAVYGEICIPSPLYPSVPPVCVGL
jgi:Hydrophobic surface binding protein A